MRNTKRMLIGGGVAGLALLAASTGIAATGAGGDSETPITGPELEKASAAALAFTGGGRVTETEVGDEESYYEVEVTLDNGNEVDVQLDKDFQVVGSKTEAAGKDDGD